MRKSSFSCHLVKKDLEALIGPLLKLFSPFTGEPSHKPIYFQQYSVSHSSDLPYSLLQDMQYPLYRLYYERAP